MGKLMGSSCSTLAAVDDPQPSNLSLPARNIIRKHGENTSWNNFKSSVGENRNAHDPVSDSRIRSNNQTSLRECDSPKGHPKQLDSRPNKHDGNEMIDTPLRVSSVIDKEDLPSSFPKKPGFVREGRITEENGERRGSNEVISISGENTTKINCNCKASLERCHGSNMGAEDCANEETLYHDGASLGCSSFTIDLCSDDVSFLGQCISNILLFCIIFISLKYS